MDSRYSKYGAKTNAFLNLSRSVRQVEKLFPDKSFLMLIPDEPAQEWWWELTDIILDYEEAQETSEAQAARKKK